MSLKMPYLIFFVILFIGACSENPTNGNVPAPTPLPDEFIFGADLSYVNQVLEHGGIYKLDDVVTDPYSIFADLGTTTTRFRLFNNPIWTHEIYGKSGAKVYNDLNDVTLAIQRSKQFGMKILLVRLL